MQQINTCRYIRMHCMKNDNKPERMHFAVLFLLFLMAMNFATRFFYLAFISCGITILIRRKGFEIPKTSIPAFALAVSMCVFSYSTRGGLTAMIKPYTYPLCIITGYNLAYSRSMNKNDRQLLWVIVVLAAGAYGHFFLNMLNNLGKGLGRNTIDFWRKSVLSATGQSSLACIMIGTAISMLFSNYRKSIKVLFLCILISILFYNLMLGGRTIFVLCIAILVGNIITEWIMSHSLNKKIKILLVAFFSFLIIYIAIHMNLFGVQEVFYNSNFFKRFFTSTSDQALTSDGRMEYKILFLRNMLYYPFGKNELHIAVGNHYAHDLLLDAYSDSGIIAFISLVFMLVVYTRRVINFAFNPQNDANTKRVLINVTIVIFFVFFMEPILDGLPWLLASFCVIYGVLARFSGSQNTQESKKHRYVNS